jgi:hypothetical protein
MLGPSSCLKWHVDLFKKILATGNVKAIPVFIQPNGIAGVKDGLQYMQDGKVSLMRLIVVLSPIDRMRINVDCNLAGQRTEVMYRVPCESEIQFLCL